jgi:hypothetical protein
MLGVYATQGVSLLESLEVPLVSGSTIDSRTAATPRVA